MDGFLHGWMDGCTDKTKQKRNEAKYVGTGIV